RTGRLVEARLTFHADRDERVINTPHGAEQSDEGRDRSGRGQERQTGLQAVRNALDRAVQRSANPLVQRNLIREAAFVVLSGADADLGDNPIRIVLAGVLLDAVPQITFGPDALLHLLVGHWHATLVPQLRDDNGPTA